VTSAWSPGDVIVERDISRGRPWLAHPVYVVEDTAELLVTYIPEAAPLGYLPDSDHPWHPKPAWTGHGALALRRPGDPYSLLHFWMGADRSFACWYVNLETPYGRTPIGFDMSDRELDVVAFPDGTWKYKDWDMLDEHVRRGRYTAEDAAAIRADGAAVTAMLDAGTQWWDDRWVSWAPPPGWVSPTLRADWADPPVVVDDHGPVDAVGGPDPA
jgi:hypothetical protein